MDRAPLPDQNDQAENDGNANFIAKKSTLYSYDSQNYFHMSTLKSLKPAGINRLELDIKDVSFSLDNLPDLGERGLSRARESRKR